METAQCKKCSGKSKNSKAIQNVHNIQTQDLSREFETNLIDCLKCEDCGHSWIPSKESKDNHDIAQKAMDNYFKDPLPIDELPSGNKIIEKKHTVIKDDKIIIYGCGRFNSETTTLNKEQAMLLYLDIHKFIFNN